MFKEIQKAVAEEYSGLRAKEYIAEIIPYHRIQASPGFRAAAERCRQLLAGFGLSAEVLTFPANESTSYWSLPMFQEWEASEATLHLIEPADKARKLADFSEIKCSLIQRSAPVDNLEAEVVLLEDGEEEQEYEGLDLEGKVVLTKGDLNRVHDLAVGRHGAVGILFDGMREIPPVRQRIDLPDTRAYTSFWWRPGHKKCFGFVLSPRQGEELRRWIKSQQREGKQRFASGPRSSADSMMGKWRSFRRSFQARPLRKSLSSLTCAIRSHRPTIMRRDALQPWNWHAPCSV